MFHVKQSSGSRRTSPLLEKWNPRINLVVPASLAEAWDRHFADSAQLWALRPPGARLWLDLGPAPAFPAW